MGGGAAAEEGGRELRTEELREEYWQRGAGRGQSRGVGYNTSGFETKDGYYLVASLMVWKSRTSARQGMTHKESGPLSQHRFCMYVLVDFLGKTMEHPNAVCKHLKKC